MLGTTALITSLLVMAVIITVMPAAMWEPADRVLQVGIRRAPGAAFRISLTVFLAYEIAQFFGGWAGRTN